MPQVTIGKKGSINYFMFRNKSYDFNSADISITTNEFIGSNDIVITDRPQSG